MRRTRWSLFYLAGYLLPTGLLQLAAPARRRMRQGREGPPLANEPVNG